MRIHREVLATLLLSSAGLAQQYSLDRIQWVKFEDRNELAVTNQKAFTMDVPRGWPVDGGMARLSALQVTPYVRMLASDGRLPCHRKPGYAVILSAEQIASSRAE